MNILFVTRPDALTRPGGDTIQVQKTKEALEAMGVHVQLGGVAGEALAWADVVHVFNAQTPAISLPALEAARDAGKKTVLSTIWWDLAHAQQATLLSQVFQRPQPLWQAGLPAFRLLDRTVRHNRYREISRLLRLPDLLLPNSIEEMQHLQRDFGQALPRYSVVYNAVDTSIFRPPRSALSGVICCARLEPTKNQLSLIDAVSKIPGVHLTLLGQAGKHKGYAKRVHLEARRYGFTVIEDHLDQADVAKVMRRHKVHALPSFRESPGLSSLEALACGLEAVISSSPFCPVDTYFTSHFAERVFVCDPYKSSSIRLALQQALTNEGLVDPFPQSFNWATAGLQTLEAYRTLF